MTASWPDRGAQNWDVQLEANVADLQSQVDLKASSSELAASEAAANATYERQDRRALNLLDLIGGSVSGSNDTAAVNAALAAFDAAGGGTLRIPKANWLFTGSTGLSLTGTANPIHLIADPGTIFDMTGSTATIGMTLGGSLGSTTALGADVSSGSSTVTCALAVVAGDTILIESTDLWVGSTTAVKGEMAEVYSVSGGVITLRSPLWDGYTAATTTVRKVTAPRVTVQGLTILRNSNHQGLMVQYAKDVVLRDCYGEGARERLFHVSNCLGVTIDNCRGRDFWYSGTGTSYGVSIASCMSVTTIGGDFRGGRHAITHGGTWPTRDITILGGTYDSHLASNQYAVDFHNNCENVRVEGATILGGLIDQGASNVDVVNCTIRGKGSIIGVKVYLERTCDYKRVRGCDIRTTGGTLDGVQLTTSTTSTVVLSDFEVTGNIINAAGYALALFPGSAAHTGYSINRVKVSGRLKGGTACMGLLRTGGAAEIAVGDFNVDGADIKGGTTHGFVVTNTGTGRINLRNSRLAITTFNASPFNNQSGSYDVTAQNSTFAGEGTTGYHNYFNTGSIVIEGCVFDSLTGNRGIYAALASEVRAKNNRFVNCTGTVNFTARWYTDIGPLGQVVTYKNGSAPSAGTWAVGDICWNTTTAAAGVPGWVCTTAGTPGTWKAMAAVAA